MLNHVFKFSQVGATAKIGLVQNVYANDRWRMVSIEK